LASAPEHGVRIKTPIHAGAGLRRCTRGVSLSLYIKHRLVGTAPGRSLDAARWLLRGRRRHRHPELAEVFYDELLTPRVLDRVLRPDSCCVDVGAHVGSMLHELTRRAPAGRHVAIEASPMKARWLRSRYRGVEVIDAAVGEAEGEIEFHENLSRPGFSSLARPAGEGDRVRTRRVRLARLDDLLPGDRRIDFIKIDVEGAELGVLRGAERTIDRWRPVVLFESGPGGAERCGYSRGELFEFFAGRGYDVFLLKSFLHDREPLDAGGFDRCHLYPFRAFNYLGVPRERAEVRPAA